MLLIRSDQFDPESKGRVIPGLYGGKEVDRHRLLLAASGGSCEALAKAARTINVARVRVLVAHNWRPEAPALSSQGVASVIEDICSRRLRKSQ